MLPKRVIPCLDIDDSRVVKGTNFVDLHDVGDPVKLAKRYEAEGADELVFLDISATVEQRATMIDIARRIADEVFIPFTVGGGIRSESDVQQLLDAGADKVAVNSAALAKPTLLNKLARRFGRQCVTLAIDAKSAPGGWEVYASGGQIATGKDAVSWSQEAVKRGAGEILLTSIDRDGTGTGYDLDLLQAVRGVVKVPVIASGGAGKLEHYEQALSNGAVDAVLAASKLHSGESSIGEIKSYLADILGEASVRPIQSIEPIERIPVKLGESPHVAVVDYGVGNRYSVIQALQFVGADVRLTADNDDLEAADGIILPGVGAFGQAMESLRERGLNVKLQQLAQLGKPILGICLGEQLLFSGSEEDGWNRGLNLVSGEVQEIKTEIKPNIGWRRVAFSSDSPLSEEIPSRFFYHLHSYAAVPDDESVIFAHSAYIPSPKNADSGGIVSGVQSKNIYGVQFHPEKSSTPGLKMLDKFIRLCRAERAKL